MKASFLSFVSLLIVGAASLHAAEATHLKARVTGFVQTQVLLTPTEGRIHASQLNNKRIFQEFQVSETDYELVVSFGDTNGLYLLPRQFGTALPTIPVALFGTNSQQLMDTRVRVISVVSDLASNTTSNLFNGLAGEIAGAMYYTGDISSPLFKSVILNVSGYGTDFTSLTSGPALLKFKITASRSFIQAP